MPMVAAGEGDDPPGGAAVQVGLAGAFANVEGRDPVSIAPDYVKAAYNAEYDVKNIVRRRAAGQALIRRNNKAENTGQDKKRGEYQEDVVI